MKKRFERTPTVARSRSPYAQAVKIKTETGVGAVKTFAFFGIILAQIALFVYLSIYFASVANWALALSLSFSLITCIVVLSSEKNSLSKAVWIIFILVCFTFGYIIFIMSDERIFFRKSKKRYDKIFERTSDFLLDKNAIIDNNIVKKDANYLLRTGKFPSYNNTDLKYYSSGTQFFDDVIESLKSAKNYIFIEFFIVSDGYLLSRFIDVLKERAQCGVDIRLIYDDMGSHKTLSLRSKKLLKKAGVKVCSFNRLVPIFSIALNCRDHRKIIVVDGKVAYTGGCNLADEYVNEKRLHGYWKDAGIRLDGTAVDSLTVTFLRQWEFLSKKTEDYSIFLGKYNEKQNNSVVIPYADGLDYGTHIGKGVYENVIASANEKIMIMTPYFIVDDAIEDLLSNKALSGVDVTMILPEVPDKKYVYGVTRSNAEKLIDYGVKIYTMRNSFVHSKVVLTENCAIIGSINLDLRSFYQQFECAVYTDDKAIMESVEKDFISTCKDSLKVTEKNKFRRSLFYRIYVGLMKVFAPFM